MGLTLESVRGASDCVEVDGREVYEMLERLKWAKIVKAKDVRKEVRGAMSPARRTVMQAARGAMGSDPRKASQGVKLITYKDGNGGMINLFNARQAKSMAVEGSHSTGGRSGIKRKRKISADTKRINGYRGRDRAFILRFVNQGTVTRTAGGKSGMKPANRGKLTGKMFFTTARSAVQQASTDLLGRVVKLIGEASAE